MPAWVASLQQPPPTTPDLPVWDLPNFPQQILCSRLVGKWHLSAPNSRFQDHMPKFHLMSPPLSLSSWGFIPCLVAAGEVSQQLSESVAAEVTRVHGLQHAHVHTHALLPLRNAILEAARPPWTCSIQLTLPAFSLRHIPAAQWNRAGANACPAF